MSTTQPEMTRELEALFNKKRSKSKDSQEDIGRHRLEGRQRATRMIADSVSLFDPRAMTVEELGRHLLESVDPETAAYHILTKDRLEKAAAAFTWLAANWKQYRKVEYIEEEK